MIRLQLKRFKGLTSFIATAVFLCSGSLLASIKNYQCSVIANPNNNNPIRNWTSKFPDRLGFRVSDNQLVITGVPLASASYMHRSNGFYFPKELTSRDGSYFQSTKGRVLKPVRSAIWFSDRN